MRIAKGIIYAVLAVGVAAAQKAPKQSSTNGETSSSAITKVETRTFKGDLVNAKCAGNSASAEAKAPSKNSGEADRATAAGDQACAVSSSTSEFAIKTKDGKTMPFDLVGNLRTQDALKNSKKWTAAASSGKPIKATVSGTEHDGMLTVLSVH